MRSSKAVRHGIVLAVALAASSTLLDARPAHAGGYFEVSVGFYDTLAPYGEWFELYGVGTVWRPYTNQVGADFYPYYSGGSWVYSEYGWTWASDYAWGWVPFHHGRWIYSETYGWVWIPGDEWAPAWVEWRYGGGYIGWVPLGWGSYQVVGVVSSPWCWFRSDDFGRRDWRSRRITSATVERTAYHASAPVPPSGRTPVGPPPSGLPSAPPTIQLGRPQGLRPGDVELEKRLQRPATPRSRERETERQVAPPRGEVGPPPSERPPREGMNPPPFGDRSRHEVVPPPQQREYDRPPPRERNPDYGGPHGQPPPQQLAPPPPQGQPPPQQPGAQPPPKKGPHPGAIGAPPPPRGARPPPPGVR
jgi:hypothetical protein